MSSILSIASKFRSVITAAGLVGVFALAGCQAGGGASAGVETGSPASAAPTVLSSQPIRGDEATIMATGLSCPLCANNIDSTLKKLPGVQRVDIDLSTGRILVGLFGKSKPSQASLAKAVTDAGFTVVSVN